MANTRTNKEKLYDIIKKPVITEKSMANTANTYTLLKLQKTLQK